MYNVIVSGTDSGGINAISPVVKEFMRSKEFNLKIISDNEGAGYFLKNKIRSDVVNVNERGYGDLCSHLLSSCLPDIVVVGTSRKYSIQNEITRQAKVRDIPVVAILDYWNFYEERFRDEKQKFNAACLPDMLCIMDEYCYKEMVSDTKLPKNILRITGNPYLDNIHKMAKSGHKQKKIKKALGIKNKNLIITFASETHAVDFGDGVNSFSGTLGNYLGYTEKDVLSDINEVLLHISAQVRRKIDFIVKLHPSEKKMPSIRTNDYLTTHVLRNGDARGIISISDIVLGMTSIFLYEAALMGKRVYSYQPRLNRSDWCISNRLKLSKLIKDKERLRAVLKKEITSPCRNLRYPGKYIRTNAKKEVMGVIMEVLNHRVK